MPLKHVLNTIAWLPEALGANRENHIVRSSGVVNNVEYGRGRIAYTTFDAPEHTVDVLRLAFKPDAVTADDRALALGTDLAGNAYTVKELANGDCIVAIRHDGCRRIVVQGPDPQQSTAARDVQLDAGWSAAEDDSQVAGRDPSGGGGSLAHRFTGNQVRLIGRVGPDGGLAEVVIDGEKQRVPVDCWSPVPRTRQVLYYRNGLTPGEHTIQVVVPVKKNPVSAGTSVWIQEVQWSDATGDAGFGAGGGPAEAQRMIFGYPGRVDYVDSQGNAWRPCTEWVCRAGHLTDVEKQAWWTKRRRLAVDNTPDAELYRYGAHAPEFWVNVTVAPGTYHVRLKFMEAIELAPNKRAVTVLVNGEERVKDMDVAATAGGLNRAADLVFDGIQPVHGVIEVRFRNDRGGEAMVQAIEVGPGPGGEGATPVALAK